MIKNSSIVILFVSLLLLQVLILNNILFLGYVNPYLYIAFVFFYPLNQNKFVFLLTCFFLGLFVDFFSDSGGIHAFSITFIAYIRLFFVELYFKKNPSDSPFFKVQLEPFGKIFNYVITLTVIHHLIFFSFTYFSFENISYILINTLYSSIFSVLLFFLGTYIFTKRQ